MFQLAVLFLIGLSYSTSVKVNVRESALFISTVDSSTGMRATEWSGKAPILTSDTVAGEATLRARDASLVKVTLGSDVGSLNLRLSEVTGRADLKNPSLDSLSLHLRRSRYELVAFPKNLDLTITGGSLKLDLSSARRGVVGKITSIASRVKIIFPENAQVRVIAAPSAMTLLTGKGFESVEGDYVKEGTGPEFKLTFTGALSRLSLLTAGEADGEDEKTPALVTLTTLDPVSPFLRYNRVEGLFWGVGVDTRKISKSSSGLLLDMGYAVTPRIVQFGVGAAVRLLDRPYPMNLYLMHYKKVESEDDGVMGAGENSVHSFLFGADYRDYYLTKSNLVKGDWTLWRDITLFGSAGIANYQPLAAANPFHFFGDSLFRYNPWIRPAEDHFVTAGVTVKKHGDAFPRRGWFLKSTGEYSGGAIKSQFTYRKLSAEGKGFAALSPRTELGSRLFLGEVTGKNGMAEIAGQKLFDLGGPGTVRGLPFRTDPAFLDKDRMMTLSIELKRSGELPPGWEAPLTGPLLKRLLFILFFDAGSAWNTEDFRRENTTFNNPYNDIEWGKLQRTFGAGLALRDESFRFDVMRHLAPGVGDPYDSILLRFCRAF